jgi:antitoxin ParD1/3/4
MAKRKNISVSFTPHQAEFLAQCVASGRYLSASEVVREGLRLLEREHAELHAEYDRVREMIRVGAEELERGAVVDAETVFQELDEELDALDANERRRSE